MPVSHREVWSQVSYDRGKLLSQREEVVIYYVKSDWSHPWICPVGHKQALISRVIVKWLFSSHTALTASEDCSFIYLFLQSSDTHFHSLKDNYGSLQNVDRPFRQFWQHLHTSNSDDLIQVLKKRSGLFLIYLEENMKTVNEMMTSTVCCKHWSQTAAPEYNSLDQI